MSTSFQLLWQDILPMILTLMQHAMREHLVYPVRTNKIGGMGE